MADACMRLRCLPAVGRASQVAPLRVGGGLCVVWGLACGVIIRHVRRGDIHVARMADACMRVVALPPCGRPGVTSGAPTCGRRFGRGVGGEMPAARVVACDKRGIHVGATFMSPGWRTHACGRLRCLPAVCRASQVALLRVGGGLCVVWGLACGVIIRHVRRGDIHVARRQR